MSTALMLSLWLASVAPGAPTAPSAPGAPSARGDAAPRTAPPTAEPSAVGVPAAPRGAAATPACAEGFVPLFDGATLAGWVPVNVRPDTFVARDGAIFCTGEPTGFLRSERMVRNFVLEFDWMHERPDGNAGLFVWSDPLPGQTQTLFPRSVEVQIMLTPDVTDKEGRLLYTGQGDVFSIWGARMTPLHPHPAGWERTLPSARATRGAGEWNHYKVTGVDGTLTLEVNGVEVSGARDVTPRMGYICLESEGSPVWFRNLCLRELPATGPALPPEQVAMDGEGFRRLFDGASLHGWREAPEHAGHWSARGGVLVYDGKGDTLWTEESFGDFELVADWRWTREHQGRMQRPFIGPDGLEVRNPDGTPKTIEVEERDSGIYLRGSTKAQINMWMWPCGSGEIWGYRTDAAQPAEVRAAATPSTPADKPVGEWNRFVIRMEGERVTVALNGVVVIRGARLPGVPPRGPIGLQSHGSPVEFQNLFVRPLPPAASRSAP
jgi:hypothetical protein